MEKILEELSKVEEEAPKLETGDDGVVDKEGEETRLDQIAEMTPDCPEGDVDPSVCPAKATGLWMGGGGR